VNEKKRRVVLTAIEEYCIFGNVVHQSRNGADRSEVLGAHRGRLIPGRGITDCGLRGRRPIPGQWCHIATFSA